MRTVFALCWLIIVPVSRSTRSSAWSTTDALDPRAEPDPLLPRDLRALAHRPVVCWFARLQRGTGSARRAAVLLLALHRVLGVRRRLDGELAVRVPPVQPDHPRDRLVRPARLDRVEECQGGRTEVGQGR